MKRDGGALHFFFFFFFTLVSSFYPDEPRRVTFFSGGRLFLTPLGGERPISVDAMSR